MPHHSAAEGIIKYQIEFTPALAPDWVLIAELDAWRGLLFRLGLTGQDPNRYDGLAYGNVSRRLDGNRFLVSGTQTGGIEHLDAAHYCEVTDFDTSANLIVARGMIRPSSEALTHAAAYAACEAIGCVLHVHSPELWRAAPSLGLPITDSAIAYGTPAMAAEVAKRLSGAEPRVIAMGGHEDGIIAVGETIEATAWALIRSLAGAATRTP